MKKVISLLCAVSLLMALSACGNPSAGTSDSADHPETSPDAGTVENTAAPETPAADGGTAVITIRDYGTVEVELDPAAAPATVANFVSLVRDGFYDGLTFHRIISGFMIQGGDPLGNGTGGSGQNIPGEFAQNGFENPLKHTRGTISMARAMDPDSASSQFFIMHEDAPHLDGAYAAFGHVTSGMDVVDAICESVPVQDQNGTVNPEDQPVIESIAMK